MGKFKHHTKKLNQKKSHQTKKHKGGCDAPFLPDTDGVWERTNGIKSGTFYDLLQFYKFIDWTTCNQMYKLGKDTKLSSNKITSLQAITEAKLNANFRGYTIYDTTNQIENQSHSFIFGNATVDTINKKVIFKQAPKDRVGDKILKYTFNYMDEINIIIEKEKKEFFIFSAKDSKFTLGLKTGLEMPTTRINKIKDAMRQNRKTIEETEDQLTQTQKKDRQIFANRSKKGISNSMNTGGARTRTKTRKHKSQRGGNQEYAHITTIINSGQPRDLQSKGMGSQCMWVSISDYFKYAHNQDISVIDLKKQSGLTENNILPNCGIQFDQSNDELNRSMEKLCIDNKINLNIFYNYTYSKNYKIDYIIGDNRKKSLIPDVIYNKPGEHTVNILNTPGHFELITKILIDTDEIYELVEDKDNNKTYPTRTNIIKTNHRLDDDNIALKQVISMTFLDSVIKELKEQIKLQCINHPKNKKLLIKEKLLIKDIYRELKFAEIQQKRYAWEISTQEKRSIMAEIIQKCGNIETIALLINYDQEDLEKLKNLTSMQIIKILNKLRPNLSETKFKELLANQEFT